MVLCNAAIEGSLSGHFCSRLVVTSSLLEWVEQTRLPLPKFKWAPIAVASITQAQ